MAPRPLVISLGKKTGKQIRKLREGGGPLLPRVAAALESHADERRPLVVVVERKRRRARARKLARRLGPVGLITLRLASRRRPLRARRIAARLVGRMVARRVAGRALVGRRLLRRALLGRRIARRLR